MLQRRAAQVPAALSVPGARRLPPVRGPRLALHVGEQHPCC